MPLQGHKWRALLLLAVLGAAARPAAAQQDRTEPIVTVSRAASLLAAATVFVAPHVISLNTDLPACAPCDRAAVPWFDRWVIRPERPEISHASSVLAVGLAAITLVDQARGPDGARRALSTVESAAWAVGLTELAKAVFDRSRPALYTSDAVTGVQLLTNQRSMPSGHTAGAFAVAMSYWLNSPERDPLLRGAALLAAAGVAAMRVASARHFPSDVVVGAGVGIASAIIVHRIRF